jgi:hypothetical protein
MHRIISLLAFWTFSVLSVLAQTATTPLGSGTSLDPYQIATLDNLYWISKGNGFNSYFIQTADIDASSTSGWNAGSGFSPIGSSAAKFGGHYNGNMHVIAGLSINTTSSYIGLFGYTNGAVIENLGLTGCSIKGTSYVGGLIGFNGNATVSRSYVTGTVTGDDKVGGLIGYHLQSTVTDSYAEAKVTGTASVGGLVGMNLFSASVNSSYATGAVSGNNSTGGLVGSCSSSAAVANSYATGAVSGVYYTGGLVGNNSGLSTITNSYACGLVSSSESSKGGLVGQSGDSYSACVVSNSFWDTQTTNCTLGAGTYYGTFNATGQTSLLMKTQSTFTDASWDFAGESVNGTAETWILLSERNNGYPCFQWQLSTPVLTTVVVSDITSASATSKSTLSNLGLYEITQHGVVWSTIAHPTIALTSKTEQGTLTAIGTFDSNITALEANKTYYLRAYATNAAGTSYGEELTFTTLSGVPPVITSLSPASGQMGTTVIINGNGFSITPAYNTVYFGAVKATVTASTETSLTVNVPAGAGSVVPVTVVTAGFVGNSTACTTPTFHVTNSPTLALSYTKNTIGGSNTPIHVAFADLNNDGLNDMITSNLTANYISVALGTGSGNFGTATNISTQYLPYAFRVGEFNGDKNLDIAFVNGGSNTVGIMLGNGDGTFSAASYFSVGNYPGSLVLGDFNSDGKLDISVANYSSANVSVLLGTGTGSLGAATNYAVGTNPSSISVGDFNVDGKLDMVTTNDATNNVSVLLGVGDGTFGAATFFATGTTPSSVTTGDFNSDGMVDLGVSNKGDNTVSVFWGTGTGNFTGPLNLAVGVQPFSVATGDMNGDGKADIVTANESSATVSVLLGSGTGTFGTATSFEVGTLPRCVTIGDFDGNGKADIATTNYYSNDVSLLLYSEVAPTLTTQAVSDITTTTATGNGTITDLGSSLPTQHGVVWSTSASPTVALSTKTEQGAVSVTGTFVSTMTDLTPNTTYYVRAYATNAGGTSYGDEVEFTTSKVTMSLSSVLFASDGKEVEAVWSSNVLSIKSTYDNAWSATSDQSWLTLSSGSGSGSVPLVCTAAVNSTASVRYAKVTYTMSLFSTIITVKQEPGESGISLQISVPSSVYSTLITVSSNTSWAVSTNQSWLTLSPSLGVGDGSFSWAVTANTGALRTVTLTMKAVGLPDQMMSIVQDAESRIWTGTNVWNTPADWSTGVVPENTHNVIVSSGILTIDQDVTINNLTVNPGAAVTLYAGKTLVVTGNLMLKSNAANGTATFVDYGGTLHVSGASNVEQYFTSGRNWYVSSPVTAATGNVVLGTTGNKLWQYNEANADWTTDVPATSTPLNIMNGFVANVVSDGVVTFTGGVLNTGDQSLTVNRTENGRAKRGFNLVGNPYPSYVNWESATKNNLLPSMWYRSRNALNSYVFDSYNGESHVGTNLNGFAVTANIPPLQAFWVKVSDGQTSGALSFTNAARTHKSAADGYLLRSQQAEEQQVLRMDVSNDQNRDQAILVLNAKASNGFDSYDTPKMSNENSSIPEIYTMADSEAVAINGLKSLAANLELPLGFKTGESDNFTFRVSEASNFEAGTLILLKDKWSNTTQDLTDGKTYSFSSDAINTLDRFALVIKTLSSQTDIDNTGAGCQAISIFSDDSHRIVIQLVGFGEPKGQITLYNVFGKVLLTTRVTGSSTVIHSDLPGGIYFVKALVGGKQVVRKVVLD